jgi:hypothetical protein
MIVKAVEEGKLLSAVGLVIGGVQIQEN